MAKPLDITGQRYGRLLAVAPHVEAGARKKWRCICDCGAEAFSTCSNLVGGRIRSCGCLKSEVTAAYNVLTKRTHGMYGTSEYEAWSSMKHRCENPANDAWGNYGGRGITFCEAWRSFDAFFEDMGHKPSPEHSLDRIENDGNYEPANCRWATVQEQMDNRRVTIKWTVGGIERTLRGWAEVTGIGAQRLWQRVNKDGWTPEKAVSTPVKGKGAVR